MYAYFFDQMVSDCYRFYCPHYRRAYFGIVDTRHSQNTIGYISIQQELVRSCQKLKNISSRSVSLLETIERNNER